MKAQDAWRDARPWYPGGSIYNGGSATYASQSFHSAPEMRLIP
jgi:hypothetical protein